MQVFPVDTFGSRVREARKKAGLTQVDLAESAGVSISYINKIEKGVVRDPRASALVRICKALGWELSDVRLFFTDNRELKVDQEIRNYEDRLPEFSHLFTAFWSLNPSFGNKRFFLRLVEQLLAARDLSP